MKRALLLGACCFALCALAATLSATTTPQFMNYQGRLTNSLGSPIDLTTPMTFTIYADSIGGVPIWTEMQDTVLVRNGLFTVRLGKVVPVSDTVFKSDRRWLEIRVGADAPLSPRTPFVSVAYAFRSTYADSCNFIPSSDTLWKRSGDNIYRDTGNVGIGTATPTERLQVAGAVHSTTGGFKFPDGTVQTTAAGAGNYVNLQTTTPGTQQTGNMSISGVALFGGNVGIGTTAPGAKLDVRAEGDGAEVLKLGIERPWVFKQRDAGPTSRLCLEALSGNKAFDIRSYNGYRLATFYTLEGGGSIDFYGSTRIQSDLSVDGNIGIGTTVPAKPLHVAGEGMVLDNGGASPRLWGAADAVEHNSYLHLLNATGLSTAMGVKAGGVLISDSYSYADPGKNDLVVKGRIGVANSSPAYPLDVTGNARATGTLISGGLSLSGDADLNEHYVVLGAGSWMKFNYETDETYINSPLNRGIVMRCGDAGRKLVISHDGSQAKIFSYGSMFLDAGDNTIWAERINPTVDGSFYLGGSGNRWGVGFFRDLDISRNVGIGISSPTRSLQVVQGSSTDPIADSWTTYSSRRWKENITPIPDALDKVSRLRGVYYDWKETHKHDLGMIAEEVGAVLPEIVQFEENGVDAQSLDYARLSAVLVEAVKELKNENDDLRKRLEQLEQRLTQYGATSSSTK